MGEIKLQGEVDVEAYPYLTFLVQGLLERGLHKNAFCLKTYQPLIVTLTFRGVLMSDDNSLCLSLFIFVHKSSSYTYIHLSIQSLYLSLLTFSHSNVCILQFISSPLLKRNILKRKCLNLFVQISIPSDKKNKSIILDVGGKKHKIRSKYIENIFLCQQIYLIDNPSIKKTDCAVTMHMSVIIQIIFMY